MEVPYLSRSGDPFLVAGSRSVRAQKNRKKAAVGCKIVSFPKEVGRNP
jgi:hypothetical protein